MNENLTLIERLKKAKIVQVLAVYLGASWVVLQIADVLQDAVALPQWVSGFAVLLLLIGLIIILETAETYYLGRAWRQMGPSATYRLARLYERTDRPEPALAQYRRLLTMWEGADEDFPPLLEAREAVARLGG